MNTLIRTVFLIVLQLPTASFQRATVITTDPGVVAFFQAARP